jgi:putative transposase
MNIRHQNSKYRNSRMEVYFWTDTIKDWKHLLKQDKYKNVIISSWQELVERDKIAIYGFVIMPNHLHIVWEMKEPNGREMPHTSFNKFTSHQTRRI